MDIIIVPSLRCSIARIRMSSWASSSRVEYTSIGALESSTEYKYLSTGALEYEYEYEFEYERSSARGPIFE